MKERRDFDNYYDYIECCEKVWEYLNNNDGELKKLYKNDITGAIKHLCGIDDKFPPCDKWSHYYEDYYVEDFGIRGINNIFDNHRCKGRCFLYNPDAEE